MRFVASFPFLSPAQPLFVLDACISKYPLTPPLFLSFLFWATFAQVPFCALLPSFSVSHLRLTFDDFLLSPWLFLIRTSIRFSLFDSASFSFLTSLLVRFFTFGFSIFLTFVILALRVAFFLSPSYCAFFPFFLLPLFLLLPPPPAGQSLLSYLIPPLLSFPSRGIPLVAPPPQNDFTLPELHPFCLLDYTPPRRSFLTHPPPIIPVLLCYVYSLPVSPLYLLPRFCTQDSLIYRNVTSLLAPPLVFLLPPTPALPSPRPSPFSFPLSLFLSPPLFWFYSVLSKSQFLLCGCMSGPPPPLAAGSPLLTRWLLFLSHSSPSFRALPSLLPSYISTSAPRFGLGSFSFLPRLILLHFIASMLLLVSEDLQVLSPLIGCLARYPAIYCDAHRSYPPWALARPYSLCDLSPLAVASILTSALPFYTAICSP